MKKELRKAAALALCVLTVGCGLDKNPTAPSPETGILRDSTVASAPVQKPPTTLASSTYWLKGSAIERVWDRNENEWDYLIVFKLPINYCPAWMKVYAQNWYGGLGTPRVDFYYSGFINGVYTVKFLAGSRVISWYGSDPSRYYLTFPYP